MAVMPTQRRARAFRQSATFTDAYDRRTRYLIPVTRLSGMKDERRMCAAPIERFLARGLRLRSDELGELGDQFRARLLEDLEDRADAQLVHADLREDLDDVVELLVGEGHELVLREPVAVQVLFELRPPALLVLHQGGLAVIARLLTLREHVTEDHARQHAVADAASRNRIDHPSGVADQGDSVPDRLLDRRRGGHAARDHVERLGVLHPRVLRDPTVQESHDVHAALQAVEGDADSDVRGRLVLREDPDVPRGRALPEPEFAVIGEVVPLADVREAVLQRAGDVARPQERLEAGPPAHLAFVAVRGDDALRVDRQLVLEPLRADPADPAVVLHDGGGGRLEPDVRARLCGLLRHGFVEGVPLEDDPDLVAGVRLLDRELRAVRREDLRALDLTAHPLSVERELRIFDEMSCEAFAAPHWRADLLSLLDQEGSATAHRRIPSGHRARWARADHDDVVLVGGHAHARPFIAGGYIRLTQPDRPQLLHRVELVAARIVDRADGADLDAHAALRAVLVERQVDLVQEDRVRRAGADAGPAVHAEHVVDRHDAVVPDRGTDRDDRLRHVATATPRSAPRTSSRSPRGSPARCCTRRTG